MNLIEKVKGIRKLKKDLIPTCGDEISSTIIRAQISGIDQVLAIMEPADLNYESDGDADGFPVYDIAQCPNCEYEFEEGCVPWGAPFCPNCGQPLKWEEEGEGE